MDLFTKKSIASMMAEANNDGGKGLKRVLGPFIESTSKCNIKNNV